MLLVAPVFVSNFYMSAKRKTRSPLQTGVSISPGDKKTRNYSEESASSGDTVLDALDMAENVTAKLESLEKLSLIESRLDSVASTTANIESTLCRLDADVTVLKEGAGKRDKKINELETSINHTEEDVSELQKDSHDHKAQLDKCKKDLLYLEAYSSGNTFFRYFSRTMVENVSYIAISALPTYQTTFPAFTKTASMSGAN